MDILSIGNSFSQDAQRYLHSIAKADNVSLNTFNLVIGGCSLYRHYSNILNEQDAYTLEMNGASTNFKVSLKEALLNRNWDIITLQQASKESPYYDTYQPYLNKITEFIRLCVPKAKIAIHQTWAYEQDSPRLNNELGYSDHTQMFRDIKESYDKAAAEIGADIIIPSGAVFQELIASGIEKVHRDTYHAKLGIGRYALGLIWYMTLTGNDIKANTFCDFDEEISDAEIETVKKCVARIYNSEVLKKA